MAEKKKSFSTLAENLKSIRKRPLSKEQIEKANKIFEKIDKEADQSNEESKPLRKIARQPNTEA
ncbi:MAG: hypothetical protein WCG27_07120 [Pseudomonadota bacterium]